MSADLTKRFGRGFSRQNLQQMRNFYLFWPEINQTPSGKLDLPWSAYVRLMSVKNTAARTFYEAETLRNGWSIRQLDRQVNTQFYERTSLSLNKAKMLKNGVLAKPEDVLTPEEAIKDPFVLEFLDLKNEYSMHLYLNYAREHWTKHDENSPVGLILCAAKGEAEAHYALANMPNKIVAADYRMLLPDEKLLTAKLHRWCALR